MAPGSRSANGYSAWRLIADELRSEIVDGSFAPETKLPTETELAERFSVHRNTVRQAVAALATEGLVATRQGSGTFVVPHTLLVHRIGLRTRVSLSLGQGDAATSEVLSIEVETNPPTEVSTRLRLGDRPALRLETTTGIKGTTISRSTNWFDTGLTPSLDQAVRQGSGSITEALLAVGIEDYLRSWSAVSARAANAGESRDLGTAPGAILLVVRSVNTLPDGTPLQYGLTRFRADRVELDIQHDGNGTPFH